MTDLSPTPAPRRRFTPIALVAGVAASAAIALSMTGTLSAFTAAITNSTNTAASGTLVMQEKNSDGTVTCNSTDGGANGINVNAATCATINKYGGSTTLVPGASSATTVTIANTGTVPANGFTLAAGTCTQGTNGTPNGNANDFCAKVSLVVTQKIGAAAATTIINGTTLTALAGTTTTLGAPIAAGTVVTYSFTATLASAAGNTYQGLSASQPLTWQFTS